jgi:LPS-assembly protein
MHRHRHRERHARIAAALFLFASGCSGLARADDTGKAADGQAAPADEGQGAPAADGAGTEQSLKLRLDRSLGDTRTRAPTPSFGQADRISGEFEETIVLDGNAEVRHGGVLLRGDRLVYTVASDTIQGTGHTHLYEDGIAFSGPSLDFKVEARTGTMPDASYSYAARDARGTSKLVEFLGPEKVRLNNAIFSTCGPGDDSWWIKANRLDLDQFEEEASALGAKLYFEGVPILASPIFNFPLGDHRRSGFLTPGFVLVNSTTGPEADFPYYWDIAPNRDMTITPRILPDRGLLLQNEIRFLDPRERGVIVLDGIEDDRVYGGSRGFASAKVDYSGLTGITAGINYNQVSDDNFLVDFSRSIVDSSLVVLPQTEYVAMTKEFWNATLQIQKYQTLYSLLTAGEGAPYNKVPELTVNSQRLDWGGFDLTNTTDITRFEHPTLESGSRLVENPALSYPIQSPGYYVIPKVQWAYTAYDLDPNLHPQGSWPVRSMPIMSVDSGLVFEREARLFGSNSLQTIEPRLFYTRIPYRDQSLLPNFDGGIPDPSIAQIFTENVYTGWDRVGEANDLTGAIITRVLDPDTGSEKFRAAVGSRFYFGPQLVTFPGVPPRTGKATDVLFEVSANLDKRWLFDSSLDYSTTLGQVSRGNIGVRWQPRLGEDLSLSYRYDSTLVDPTLAINEFSFSGQWPLLKRIYGVWDFDYSVLDRGWVQQLFGAEYKADCWIVRVVAQRYATAALTTTTSFFIQLELNGLTSIGQNPLDQLRRNIPGYRSITPPGRVVGPYEDYE